MNLVESSMEERQFWYISTQGGFPSFGALKVFLFHIGDTGLDSI